MGARNIIVTGGNRGLGYGIIDGLMKTKQNFNFLMGARSVDKAKAAADELIKKHPLYKGKVDYSFLDQSTWEGTEPFVKYVTEDNNTFKMKIDGLFLNAGIKEKQWLAKIPDDRMRNTCRVNCEGTLDLFKSLINDMRLSTGKVIFTGTEGAVVGYNKCSEEVQKTIQQCDLLGDIDLMYEDFQDWNKAGTLEEKGWHGEDYKMSKLFMWKFGAWWAKYPFVKTNKTMIAFADPGFCWTDLTAHMEKGPVNTRDEGSACMIKCFQELNYDEKTNGSQWKLIKETGNLEKYDLSMNVGVGEGGGFDKYGNQLDGQGNTMAEDKEKEQAKKLW